MSHHLQVLWLPLLFGMSALGGDHEGVVHESLVKEAKETLRRAARFYRENCALRGGYVYYYSLDLKNRWGEGRAEPDEIWVQPPGTPTVGLAYLDAFHATQNPYYLEAAEESALALVNGQLPSGGWRNSIRLEHPPNKNYSSLDDGQTQAALRLLMHVDRALHFDHDQIHRAAQKALDALLAAQFPNGGFPQVWDRPVSRELPVLQAKYPQYDWRNEGRIKAYWNLYTLNDGLAGTVFAALKDAHEIYGQERFAHAIQQLGQFLLLAQMPEPQPAWAQQYNHDMHPAWARAFEPPAIAARESQDVLETLLKTHRFTNDPRYLEPVPEALDYLRRSLLPNGQLARFYELRTNNPLYMTRHQNKDGDWIYTLTHDDSELPGHYGWKVASRLDAIDEELRALRAGRREASMPSSPSVPDMALVRRIIAELDEEGRWISVYRGERLVGQPPFRRGYRYLSSAVFSRHLKILSDFLKE